MYVTYRYDGINVAVESNLRKQAEVMHGIDANMQAFGDILQQNASSQQVHHLLLLLMVASIYVQILLRLKPYPMRGHWLL